MSELVVGDIADEVLVEQACRDHHVDTIVHFAAYKNVGESMQRAVQVLPQQRRCHGAAARRQPSAPASQRLVFSSSCSVYGTPRSCRSTRAQPIAPESVYAETKAIVERVLHWYGAVHGLRSVSLRYFNAAGASFDSADRRGLDVALNLVPVAIKRLAHRRPELQVFGDDYPTPDGTCVRDYIHVDDLGARPHRRDRLSRPTVATSTAVNVGTGVGSSVLEVLDGIERVAGRPVPHRIVDRRAGDPVSTFADPARSSELLGWTARYGLDEIVETAYRWHVAPARRHARSWHVTVPRRCGDLTAPRYRSFVTWSPNPLRHGSGAL